MVLICSGCTGGTRYQQAQVHYDLAPEKRPQGVTTYRIDSAELDIKTVSIGGMQQVADNPDLTIKISSSAPQLSWMNHRNQFVIETDYLGQDGKSLALCRDYGDAGLREKCKAVPVYAFSIYWKSLSCQQKVQVSIVDRKGNSIDRHELADINESYFGKPKKPEKKEKAGTFAINLSFSGESSGDDFTTYVGSIPVSLSGSTSSVLVTEKATSAKECIPYFHVNVWNNGEMRTNTGASVIRESSVSTWLEVAKNTPDAKFDSAFTSAKAGMESEAKNKSLRSINLQLQTYLDSNFSGGSGDKSMEFVIIDDDQRFVVVSKAMNRGDRSEYPAAKEAMQQVVSGGQEKPLAKAMATYNLALLALADGKMAEAQRLANESASGAVALKGGIMGNGDDDFTAKAKHLVQDLTGSAAAVSPVSPAAPTSSAAPTSLPPAVNSDSNANDLPSKAQASGGNVVEAKPIAPTAPIPSTATKNMDPMTMSDAEFSANYPHLVSEAAKKSDREQMMRLGQRMQQIMLKKSKQP